MNPDKRQRNKPAIVSKGNNLFSFTPRNKSQRIAQELWPRTRVMFLVGEAGTGKTAAAVGLSLLDILTQDKRDKEKLQLILSRPTVPVDNEGIGYLKGDINEKMAPWMTPFVDIYGDMSNSKWTELQSTIDLRVIPIGYLRGITVKNGVMIIDEAQDLSYTQIKCALTRLGRDGRIIFCGDTDQSSRYRPEKSPLMEIAKLLDDLDTVATVKFTSEDQVRDKLITDILDRI